VVSASVIISIQEFVPTDTAQSLFLSKLNLNYLGVEVNCDHVILFYHPCCFMLHKVFSMAITI